MIMPDGTRYSACGRKHVVDRAIWPTAREACKRVGLDLAENNARCGKCMQVLGYEMFYTVGTNGMLINTVYVFRGTRVT
jgi:hypothetical protein